MSVVDVEFTSAEETTALVGESDAGNESDASGGGRELKPALKRSPEEKRQLLKQKNDEVADSFLRMAKAGYDAMENIELQTEGFTGDKNAAMSEAFERAVAEVRSKDSAKKAC